MIEKEKYFEHLIEKFTDKKSRIIQYVNREGWEKFYISPTGRIDIRCQSKCHNSELQCRAKAEKGKIACRVHGGLTEGKVVKVKSDIQRSLGIYQGSEKWALQRELKEVEHLTPEELQDTTDEIKLSVALLRNYLSKTTDEQISKNPGQLIWILGEIARLKKEYFEIKHSKSVSFSWEQVSFLFMNFQLILIRLIKDPVLLSDISAEIRRAGSLIEKNGFK